MLRNAGGTSNAYTATCDFTPFSMPFLLNEVRAFFVCGYVDNSCG